jgi:hypothetical protein
MLRIKANVSRLFFVVSKFNIHENDSGQYESRMNLYQGTFDLCKNFTIDGA